LTTPEELKREWSRIISNILSFSVAEQGQKNQIVLGPEAAAVFRDFRMKSEERLRPEGDLAAIPDWGNKYPGTAARLAGILHLFQHAGDEAPWSIPVDKSTLESAISIGKYFVEHAILAYNLMGTSPGLEKAKRLWAIICSYGLSRFTLRDLHQRRRRSFTKEDLTIALDVLTRHGYIRPVDMSLGKRVGRPASQEYEVNLLVCTQNSQNSQKDAGENSFENSVNFENSSCSSDNPEEIKPETVLRQNSDEDWLEVP
jgi:replicative DNA helicase